MSRFGTRRRNSPRKRIGAGFAAEVAGCHWLPVGDEQTTGGVYFCTCHRCTPRFEGRKRRVIARRALARLMSACVRAEVARDTPPLGELDSAIVSEPSPPGRGTPRDASPPKCLTYPGVCGLTEFIERLGGVELHDRHYHERIGTPPRGRCGSCGRDLRPGERVITWVSDDFQTHEDCGLDQDEEED